MVRQDQDKTIYHKHIYDSICMIENFIVGISREDFLQDQKTLHACLMLLVHIGEAMATMQRYAIDIPYSHHQKIIDMRNFLAHQYIDIRPSLIARTIYDDIPVLKNEVIKVLGS